MGHGGNVIDELTTDHREVEEFFERLRALPAGHKDRRTVVDELTIELVRHSVAEEMYLYPAVREYLPGGDALADKEIHDHAEVERILKDLEHRDVDDPVFEDLAQKLIMEVTAHVSEEEQQLFPSLAQVCTPEELDRLGDRIRRAKKVAPTRPHPGAPDTPPGNKLLAPGAGLVDRVRDFVTGRGKA
ncbi:hemerythrin domain-containing protein [Streptomyces sp. NPDC093228]|uniref:hemerythrin domain-containing protein n=1 Tax=unclassified Streptomyces TaxID=2593676 RepID=UPI000740D238|nr:MULTISPECIES: hemerythrin domain-containing protein [unclassified Streptomyces]KUJ37993.1 hemerythrin [Streptomyces sp. NRRL F-5122]MDX3261049.1 hemerythrin domain-containing protein [Streptomyces sp. MI02-2A]REE64656.1 hemerythrin HHE cation binding domain-containing protein [Streptomyces sp. 3212.3]